MIFSFPARLCRGMWLLWSLLCLCGQAAAQGENNNWHFGGRALISFNGGSPQTGSTNLFASEGCASVSNSNGSLLFYSDGERVWDAGFNVMPNGSGLIGNQLTSCSQGVMIVQFPDNHDKYYLFVLETWIDNGILIPNGSLRYSVVDMSLNGGLGDIVPGQKNIVVDSGYSEQMTVTRGPDCHSAWLVLPQGTVGDVHSYLINASGISATPVASPYPSTPYTLFVGQLAISHDGNVLAWTSTGTNNLVWLANFDPLTGMTSNFQLLSLPSMTPYGVAFSPDDTRLYVVSSNGSSVVQYDLTLLPNFGAFAASAYVVASVATNQFASLREGPDQKLYFNRRSSRRICVINDPNQPGAACNVDTMALELPFNVFTLMGMGANPYVFTRKDTLPGGNTQDTFACFAAGITLRAPAGFDRYTWNHGATTAITNVAAPGTYWVGLEDEANCTIRIDTFHVRGDQFTVNLGPDTILCAGDSLLLNAGVAGAEYRWQDGSDEQTFRAGAAGRYSVRVSRNGCTDTGEVWVQGIRNLLAIIPGDTVICRGDALALRVETDIPGNLYWNTGHAGQPYKVQEPGLYTALIDGPCGTIGDSVRIDTRRCDCPAFLPNAFSPNGDGINDLFGASLYCTPVYFRLQVFNRYGQRVFETFQIEQGWDGTFKGRQSDIGTYFYYLQFKDNQGNEHTRRGDVHLLR